MRTETKQFTYYKFDELSDKAKDKAIEKLWDLNVSHEWWECTYDSFVADCAEAGLTVDAKRIYFNGFYIQGQGACFDGELRLADALEKKCLGVILGEGFVEKDAILNHFTTEEIADFMRSVIATTKGKERYYFQCTEIECDDEIFYPNENYPAEKEKALNEFYKSLKAALTEFMEDKASALFTMLLRGYDYLTSREAIIESIEANDYEFDEDGNLA